MSQFTDHSVASVCRRIRNIPLLELLAVSFGSMCLPSSIHPSSNLPVKEVSGTGGRLSGAERRSDVVIIRLASTATYVSPDRS